MIKLILFSFLSLLNQHGDEALNISQSIESMLCKEWKTRFFEEGGRKEYPDAGEENDRFIFHINHTAQMIEAGESQDGLWEYHAASKQLVFTDRVSKDKITMKVILLTEEELVLQVRDADGTSTMAHLVPVK